MDGLLRPILKENQMDIACWNCKTGIKLDKAAVEAALAQMDASKVGFHDVHCASCGKSNRATRDVFTAGLEAFAKAAKVADEPALTRRGAARKTKAENARRRGEAVGKGAKKGRR